MQMAELPGGEAMNATWEKSEPPSAIAQQLTAKLAEFYPHVAAWARWEFNTFVAWNVGLRGWTQERSERDAFSVVVFNANQRAADARRKAQISQEVL